MAWTIPTLKELRNRIWDDIETEIEGTDPRLPRGVLRVIGIVMAGISYLCHLFLQWLAKQVFPDTADAENLDRWGSLWITRKAAEKATGSVTVYGLEGSNIPAGTKLKRSDGETFLTDSSVDIGPTQEASVNVTAETAGTDGNTESGSKLTFESAPEGVNNEATVDAPGITGGLDVESNDDYLNRLSQRLKAPPAGGKKSDYEIWVLAYPGVTRAWPYPEYAGYGTIGVGCVMDEKTTYPDLVRVGDFATDSILWVKGDGWSIASGKADCDGSQTSTSDLEQDLDMRLGRQYKVKFTVSDYTAGTITPYLGTAAGTARSANGTYEENITCAGDDILRMRASSDFDGKIDDVSVVDETSYIVPSAETIDDIETYVDDYRPVAVKEFKVIRTDAVAVDFQIQLNDSEGNEISDYSAVADLKAAIEAQLESLIYEEGEPPEGTSESKYLLLSHINEAIANASGHIDHVLHVPSSNVQIQTDEILVMGTITWGS